MKGAKAIRNNTLSEDRLLFWVSLAAFLIMWLIAGIANAETQTGYATYFTVSSCQREGNSGITASGIRLYDSAYVCALPHRRFGKSYRVCLADQTDRCVIVTHLDFGPGRKPRERGVVIDLSRSAFEQLAPLKVGKLRVTVEPTP